MKQKVAMLDRVREILASGGWTGLKVRQLYHDRDEVTLFAWRGFGLDTRVQPPPPHAAKAPPPASRHRAQDRPHVRQSSLATAGQKGSEKARPPEAEPQPTKARRDDRQPVGRQSAPLDASQSGPARRKIGRRDAVAALSPPAGRGRRR